MLTGLPRVVLLLAFAAGCSPADDRPAANDAAKAEDPPKAANSTVRVRERVAAELPWNLSREEIWQRGVERFGWRPAPPRDATKEEIVQFYLTDARFEDYVDPVDG